MSIAFVDRSPSREEVSRLRLALGTFGDGSGQERSDDGTRAGWRDIERVVADFLGGDTRENKDVFDVYVPDSGTNNTFVGLSVKSKILSRATAISDLSSSGRVYMELCNSPAKLWNPLHAQGITEADFQAQRHPQAIGDAVLATVESWHTACKSAFESGKNRKLDLERSAFLVLSSSPPRRNGTPRRFQFHSFDLGFKKGINWTYSSGRCLRATDPDYPNETLFDWYALSGGQLKYYPRATESRYCSIPFEMSIPRQVAIAEKAARYWRQEWINGGGSTDEANEAIAQELEMLGDGCANSVRAQIMEVAELLRKL